MTNLQSTEFPISDELKESIENKLNMGPVEIKWLAGDGSDRRYFRVTTRSNTNSSYVLMLLSGSDGIALNKGQYDWISIGSILAERRIRTPKIISILPSHSALIIEDYGDIMLETKIVDLTEKNSINEIRNFYTECFLILANLLKIRNEKSRGSTLWQSRSFDIEKLTWELNFFLTKYMINVAKVTFDQHELQIFQSECRILAEYLASFSQYFVHRDLHSRNLMCLQNEIALIDFQDARLGPPSYDLVSLVFDSYVPFNAAMRNNLLSLGIEVIKNQGLTQASEEIFETWKPMLLQRQLKAIGSFGYLTNDKKKGDYLKYVAPALKTLEDQSIADERWPFLSSVLLRKIRDTLVT